MIKRRYFVAVKRKMDGTARNVYKKEFCIKSVEEFYFSISCSNNDLAYLLVMYLLNYNMTIVMVWFGQ